MSRTSLSTLRIRKSSTATTYDLEDDWGARLTECPLLFSEEVKEVQSVDYPDADGIDTYENSTVYMKAFDAEFKIVMTTSSPSQTHTKIKEMLDYLTKNGAFHQIYCPWSGLGRQKCRFKKLSNKSQHRNSSNEYVVEFSLVFTIEDPTGEVGIF